MEAELRILGMALEHRAAQGTGGVVKRAPILDRLRAAVGQCPRCRMWNVEGHHNGRFHYHTCREHGCEWTVMPADYRAWLDRREAEQRRAFLEGWLYDHRRDRLHAGDYDRFLGR